MFENEHRDQKGAFFSPGGSTEASPAEGFGRCGKLCCGSARNIQLSQVDQRFKRALVNVEDPFAVLPRYKRQLV